MSAGPERGAKRRVEGRRLVALLLVCSLAVSAVRLGPNCLLADRLYPGGLAVTRLSREAELAAALPDARHGLAQLLVGDVEVALRLLDVGVAEHQLDRSDVDAVGQQPAGALVTVMPRAA